MSSSSSDRGVTLKSKSLQGRRLALGICGGIGSVESVKIIRELRRHGAEVIPFLTPAVERFITVLSIEWAAGRKVVQETSAEVDHLEPFDLVIVAPATLNTITKASVGIADNAVTLLIAGQLGRKGAVLFCPTMNQQLKNHPAYPGAVEKLSSWGAQFFVGEIEEDRMKMPDPEKLASVVVTFLSKK